MSTMTDETFPLGCDIPDLPDAKALASAFSVQAKSVSDASATSVTWAARRSTTDENDEDLQAACRDLRDCEALVGTFLDGPNDESRLQAYRQLVQRVCVQRRDDDLKTDLRREVYDAYLAKLPAPGFGFAFAPDLLPARFRDDHAKLRQTIETNFSAAPPAAAASGDVARVFHTLTQLCLGTTRRSVDNDAYDAGILCGSANDDDDTARTTKSKTPMKMTTIATPANPIPSSSNVDAPPPADDTTIHDDDDDDEMEENRVHPEAPCVECGDILPTADNEMWVCERCLSPVHDRCLGKSERTAGHTIPTPDPDDGFMCCAACAVHKAAYDDANACDRRWIKVKVGRRVFYGWLRRICRHGPLMAAFDDGDDLFGLTAHHFTVRPTGVDGLFTTKKKGGDKLSLPATHWLRKNTTTLELMEASFRPSQRVLEAGRAYWGHVPGIQWPTSPTGA